MIVQDCSSFICSFYDNLILKIKDFFSDEAISLSSYMHLSDLLNATLDQMKSILTVSCPILLAMVGLVPLPVDMLHSSAANLYFVSARLL